MNSCFDELDLAGDAEVDALLLEDNTGLLQDPSQPSQPSHVPTTYRQDVSA